jgi:hypothetical protein
MDRMYKVVADVGMRDLIHSLEGGKARIVDEVPLFDRAVDAVINGMKNYMGAKGDGHDPQQMLN